MAKVKIQGHASGTGILTVTAPNTSTDRTITLPDATGTLLNSDGDGSSLTSLPQSFTGAVTATTDMVVHAGGAARKMFMGISSDDLAIGNYSSGNTVRNEHLKITSGGRGVSQFTAKAWWRFDGTGTVAIADSHNISSVGDTGTGDYRIYYDVDLDSPNHSAHIQSQTASDFSEQWDNIKNQNAAYVDFDHKEGGSNADSARIMGLVFGD